MINRGIDDETSTAYGVLEITKTVNVSTQVLAASSATYPPGHQARLITLGHSCARRCTDLSESEYFEQSLNNLYSRITRQSTQ
jgi:hypothetical protein